MAPNTRSAPIAHAPSNLPSQTGTTSFDPSAWLASFRNLDGGYVIAGGQIHLFVVTSGIPANEARMARRMLANLSDWELQQVNDAVVAFARSVGRA